jgi:hypothetical protein|tara:strand:+ start:872 stop:1144 length:273 start_codon:yes stop_codon:yes gene_type:complete
MTKKEKKMTNSEKTRKGLSLLGDYGKTQRQNVRDENIEFLENLKFNLYGLSAEINEMQKQIDFYIRRQKLSGDKVTLEELKERYNVCDND